VNHEWLLAEGEDAHLLHVAASAFVLCNAPEVVGVAVSGGSDSMAMLHLMAKAAPHAGWRVHAVTVDHALRPESAAEAAEVGRICAGLGVPHDVLLWDHGAIAGNLQDQARRARYGLMADWARARGIGHVALAHTADDQAETFLMGLARGAGLDGLSGMRREWTQGGITFHRPFLLKERTELRAWLTRHGIGWIDDPSNDNDRFTRVRARRALKALKPLGITVEKLSGTVVNLSRAQRVVERAVCEAATRVSREQTGSVILDREAFRHLGPELERRLLIAALNWVSSAEYAPRADGVCRVGRAIGDARDSTLHGCRIRVTEAEVRITREPRAVRGRSSPTDQLWDGRWRMDGPHDPALEIRALGAEGLRRCKDWRATGESRDALLVSPAVWRGETLLAAPLAGLENGWKARIVAGFESFLLSH
jgi:tRNA(Ile)-lysidine synthase